MNITEIRALNGRQVRVVDNDLWVTSGTLNDADVVAQSSRSMDGTGSWHGEILVLVIDDVTHEVTTNARVTVTP